MDKKELDLPTALADHSALCSSSPVGQVWKIALSSAKHHLLGLETKIQFSPYPAPELLCILLRCLLLHMHILFLFKANTIHLQHFPPLFLPMVGFAIVFTGTSDPFTSCDCLQ